MFRKAHLKLTFLCSGITIVIILVMSVLYLSIAERNLKEISFVSFQNDMNTVLANLENQTVITDQWLAKMEGNGKYQIGIWDNGRELLFNSRQQDAQRQLLFDAARSYDSGSEAWDSAFALPGTSHQEFSFPSSPGGGEDYYACSALIRREAGTLHVLILRSLAPLERQLRQQRLAFLLLILVFSAALALFAWYFTKRLLRPIEESHKSQLQFVAAASHELRTPLTVLLSAASACEKAESEEQPAFFKTIREQGGSMSRLIDDLLTLAGADSRTWSMELGPCELDTLLLDTYEAFEPLAAECGHTLAVRLPDGAVPSVRCDSERIRQVLSILLHNALSYTPPGGRIALALEKGERTVTLTVSDNGPGIPDGEKERIFDRFYRADAARSVNGHFGLGLSIAQEIMQAHYGSLRVSDTPGGGATFVLSLPV